MPDQPAVPPPPFLTSIRLPPHQLELDEGRFLRLLAGCVCLLKEEKRKIIKAAPRLSQYQIDELIEIWEDEAQQRTPTRAIGRNGGSSGGARRGSGRSWNGN